uniref:Bloodthirsty-related gene family, member 2 n=1 Tax=Sphaeramia orbicularis TaxID=375764 RepID=A0A672Z6P0_9TELE
SSHGVLRNNGNYHFLCSICLDVFTDPVSTPCGHNFCHNCIAEHWRVNVPHKCPMCQDVFHSRPQLKTNTFICEMVQRFKQEVQQEDRMCRKHDKPLELFCKPDQTCICLLCTVLDHKNHDRTEAEIQQMIQERQLKIQEIQQTTKKQAQDFINGLELEICELENRRSEVDQLSGSEDHLQVLQRLPSIRASPSMKTWTEVWVRPPSFEGMVVRAVSELEDQLREDMKKVFEAELRRVQQFSVEVTLDPDSAHRELVLSEDRKQVRHGDGRKKLLDKPQRFSVYCNVFGEQRFSSGRSYFEVQVKDKTKWTVGVARESIDRKGTIPLSPAHGFWTIWLRNGDQYEALDEADVHLRLTSSPQKVGVFVDYEEGVVSFYDADSADLIYSFIGCCFTDRLRPFFSPCLSDGGRNSAPLVITPIVHIK